MNFLNPILLFGLAAFAIPLIIHLLNKRRFREVRWAAVHLLHNVVKKNHRRLRIEQLLLLLLRMGIPVLLALMMAKPVLTRSIRWLEDQRVSTLFLIDRSYSMQAGNAESPLFNQAKKSITEVTGGLNDGSDVAALLVGGSRATPLTDQPTTDRDTFIEKLSDLKPDADCADMPEALQASFGELQDMEHVAREVVIVSDFQTSDWESPARVAQRQAAVQSLAESRTPVSLTLFRVGASAEGVPRENLAIMNLESSQAVVGRNQKFTIRATIKNFGQQSWPDLPVQCKIDGLPHRTSRISVAPGQQTQALFTHTFSTAGSHLIEVSLQGDALKADNQYTLAVQVLDELPTLLIVDRENINAAPLQGEADFLEIALQPHAASRGSSGTWKDLIATQKVALDQVHPHLLEKTKVAIVANVKQFGGATGHLDAFVKQGGGLIVFLGGKVDIDWYNRELFRDGDGMLPLPIQRVDGEGVAESTASATHIKTDMFDHPALAFFNDPRNGQLGKARWTRWFRLGLDSRAAADLRNQVAENTNVIARFSNGDPFLVEKKSGEGRVLLVAAPPNADWSNLPTLPVFVPLMQQLVSHLAASVQPPHNLHPGDTITRFFSTNQNGKTVRIVDPLGNEHQVKIQSDHRRGIVEFENTDQPGVYTMTDPDGRIAFHVVTLSRTESDLQVLSDQAMATLAEELDAPVVTSWQEYQTLDRKRRLGTGIWRPLLWILLAFLFLEVIFEQWMARRKLGPATGTP